MMKGYRDILRKNRNMLTGIGFVMVISAIFAVAAGYSLSWILNAYEAQGDRVRQLILASLGSVGMFGLCILTEYLGDLSLAWMQRRIKNDLRKMASRKLASLSYEEFYQKDSAPMFPGWETMSISYTQTPLNSCFRESAEGFLLFLPLW